MSDNRRMNSIQTCVSCGAPLDRTGVEECEICREAPGELLRAYESRLETPRIREKTHPMSNIRYAVDAYDGDMARRKCSKRTRIKYQWLLEKFIDHLGRGGEGVDEINREDCQRFLDQWRDSSASTMALHHSILNGFFRFLRSETAIEANPMDNIRRPKRERPENLDVVTITNSDVQKMIQACAQTDELVCIAILAYLGPRRTALANLRRRDLDLDRGTIRFEEKGAKTIVKPMPTELHALLSELDALGEWLGPADFVVKNRRVPKNEERSNKVIYRIVKDVAKRARVTTHVHAIRAAFSVRFLESHPGDLDALQHLLGHERADTTRVYLRRQDKFAAMERVLDLSWGGSGFPSRPAVPPTGFEPVLPTSPALAPLERKLAELRARSITGDGLGL